MKRTIEWYETKDKLPEPWITVLVSGGLAYYDPKSKTWHTRTGSDTGKIIEWPVTHWAELPSIYDLPDEEIDITKTMYPSDMMKAGKCINPSDGKICEAPDLDFIEFWRRHIKFFTQRYSPEIQAFEVALCKLEAALQRERLEKLQNGR